MLDIKGWTVGPFAENPYLLACAESGQAVFIDPGDAAPRLLRAIEEAGVKVQAILLTHAHLDHVGALTELREATGAPVYLHPADDVLLQQAQAYWEIFGKQIEPIAPAEHTLHDGDRVTFGKCELEVIHTPGHTPGSVCFYAPDDGTLIAGDTLFFQSVGRTDLPGGDTATLLRSIRTRLWELPDETEVLPGHGQPTTIGYERRNNPFVKD
jgi:hydroxyacylglutathione hydrolase